MEKLHEKRPGFQFGQSCQEGTSQSLLILDMAISQNKMLAMGAPNNKTIPTRVL